MKQALVILPGDIAWPLMVGLVVSGLISALVPPDFLGESFGGGWGGKFAMLLFGIPVYVCATASVPIALALMSMGLSPGAALVFLMTGPATNAATFTTVGKVMGWKVVAIYLFSVAVTALAAGWLLDVFFTWQGNAAVHHVHSMLSPWVKTTSSILLLGLFVHARWRRK